MSDLSTVQIIGILVGTVVGCFTIAGATLGVAKVWFDMQFAMKQQVKDDEARDARAEKNRCDAALALADCKAELLKRIDEVETMAGSTEREVTGTHNAARAKMDGQIAFLIEEQKTMKANMATKESVDSVKAMIVDLKSTMVKGRA